MFFGREPPRTPLNAKAFLARCQIMAQRKFYCQMLACFTNSTELKSDLKGKDLEQLLYNGQCGRPFLFQSVSTCENHRRLMLLVAR